MFSRSSLKLGYHNKPLTHLIDFAENQIVT